jgi:aspartokinase/homoserine dehydrogenase 1
VSTSKKACVVSAIGGVTDLLTEAAHLAKNSNYQAVFKKIKKKHFDIIESLLEKPFQERIKKVLLKDFEGLENIFKTIGMSKLFSENIKEVITGHGELWAAQILNELLKQEKMKAQWINARDVLCLKSNTGSIRVAWEISEKKLQEKLINIEEKIIVITGFVASTIEGVPTTLKRNGSDISASIFGNLLGASTISIWSDVDGIMSANPQYVPRAGVLKQVSYDEAMEMAYFGAKILHPHTLAPAMKKKIPIRIRNTSNQKHPGTLIGELSSKGNKIIKGLSNVNQLAVVNVEGTNMIGIPGMAHRVFGSLKEKGLSVVLISQASSEHSICFCVPYEQAKVAQKALEEEFYRELKEQRIGSVSAIGPCSIMAAVGENMNNTPGVASTFFRALGKANINVRAIAQGSSERNISAVIDQKDVKKAMKAVHAGFYLSPQTLSIGLIGPGLIGKAILNQLRDQKDLLKEKFDFDFRIRGICNSKSMLLDDDQIDLKYWEKNFKNDPRSINYDEFIKSIQTDEIPHTCLIDCTANNEMARSYPQWIKKGIHIITPNKKANSLEYSLYEEIKDLLVHKRVQYFYEATVGAGLPIISTLKDLIQTGDEVLSIEGVFSGTLSYIFNNFSEKKKF